MNRKHYTIREAYPDEFDHIGKLMVDVYSNLEDFPGPLEQPKYYDRLRNIGKMIVPDEVLLLVAIREDGEIGGVVLYFNQMKNYGSGGTATREKNAAGFRLLAVDAAHRGQGVGSLLVKACLNLARETNKSQVIIHSTKSMKIAWKMYEKLDFQRSPDLDFLQQELEVFGFRLRF